MRLLLLALAIWWCCPTVAVTADDRKVEIALYKVTEVNPDDYKGLMKLKAQRYNACVRALAAVRQLYVNGKRGRFELSEVAEELVESAVRLHRDPKSQLSFLEMHVEFADNLHKEAVKGPPLGAGPSPFEIAHTEARLLEAKITLLEAQQKFKVPVTDP